MSDAVVVGVDWDGCRYPFYTLAALYADNSSLAYPLSSACAVDLSEVIPSGTYSTARIILLVFAILMTLLNSVVTYLKVNLEYRIGGWKKVYGDFTSRILLQGQVTSIAFCIASIDPGYAKDTFSYGSCILTFVLFFLPLNLIISYMFMWRQTLDSLSSTHTAKWHEPAVHIVNLIVCIGQALPSISYSVDNIMLAIVSAAINTFCMWNYLYGYTLYQEVTDTSSNVANGRPKMGVQKQVTKLLAIVIGLSTFGLIFGTYNMITALNDLTQGGTTATLATVKKMFLRMALLEAPLAATILPVAVIYGITFKFRVVNPSPAAPAVAAVAPAAPAITQSPKSV